MRCGPSGAVAHSRVGPNTATVGVPTAAATCIAPESLASTRDAVASTPASAIRLVQPVTSATRERMASGSRAVTSADARRSAAAPTSATQPPSAIQCSTTRATDAAGHCLAVP